MAGWTNSAITLRELLCQVAGVVWKEVRQGGGMVLSKTRLLTQPSHTIWDPEKAPCVLY